MELATNRRMPITNPSRPREKLVARGCVSLSDVELIAIILGTGSVGEPVEVLSSRVLHHVGGSHALAAVDSAKLMKVRGMGRAKSMRLLASIELGRRVAGQPRAAVDTIHTSADIGLPLIKEFRHAKQESFLVVIVDAKNRLIARRNISTGGRASCPVDPAAVFRIALEQAAHGIVFVHNHPSGDCAPSDDDIALTEQLCLCARLLQIRVLDHIILGHQDYYSFADQGLLTP